jgi:hypothetical protein
VLSCLGALAYAELGAMIPATGGPYVFLRKSYGPLLAFLSGWTYFEEFAEGGRAVELSGTHDLMFSNPRELLEQVQTFVTSLPERRRPRIRSMANPLNASRAVERH